MKTSQGPAVAVAPRRVVVQRAAQVRPLDEPGQGVVLAVSMECGEGIAPIQLAVARNDDVDARFRTIADSAHRAIGGVSMGAHGAVQLAFNYPGTFSVVGAHSLVLRRYEQAPAYFGLQADYAKRDPMQLAVAKTDLLRSVDLWVDIGDKDPWASLAKQFDGELNGLKVTHIWHEWSGDHSATYWSAHLGDYLHFYGNALAKRAVVQALPLN